jgi:hypothetical protein
MAAIRARGRLQQGCLWTEESVQKRAIVIGSGLAGTVLANDLANQFDVLILERGPDTTYTTPTVRYEKRSLAAVPTFCYGVGGTTNLWHNGLVPLRPSDLSPGPFRDVVEDSRRFMDAAAVALHFSGPCFAEEHARLLGEMEHQVAEAGMSPGSLDCLVYPKTHGPVKPGPGVRIEADVEKIEFDREGDRVVAVRFKSATGLQTRTADLVVVAAGSLGTPGVLQNLRPLFGRPSDGIGTGLIDHPMGFVGKVRFKKEFSRLAASLASTDRGSFAGQLPFRLPSPCGDFVGCAYLRPSVTMSNRLDVHKYKSRLGASRGTNRLRAAFDARLLHPDILSEIGAHLFGVRPPGDVYSILFVGEQKRAGNRVFNEGEDLVVDWAITEEELGSIRGMLAELEARLEPFVDDLVIQDEVDDSWLWSCAHHSGTTELGTDDASVVDLDLRMRGSHNVFVCDASVLQEHSYANTGLTIAQLALRLSDHLKAHEHSF